MKCGQTDCGYSHLDITNTLDYIVATDPEDATFYFTITNRTSDTFQVVADPPAKLKDSGNSIPGNDQFPLTGYAKVTTTIDFNDVDAVPGNSYNFTLEWQRNDASDAWTYYYNPITITF